MVLELGLCGGVPEYMCMVAEAVSVFGGIPYLFKNGQERWLRLYLCEKFPSKYGCCSSVTLWRYEYI